MTLLTLFAPPYEAPTQGLADSILATSGLVAYYRCDDNPGRISPVALSVPGTSDSSPGVVVHRLSPIFHALPGATVVVHVSTAMGPGDSIGVWSIGSSENHFEGGGVGDHTFTVTNPGTGSFIYSFQGGSFNPSMTGAGTFDYVPGDIIDSGPNGFDAYFMTAAVTPGGASMLGGGQPGGRFDLSGAVTAEAVDDALLDLGDNVTMLAMVARANNTNHKAIVSKGTNGYYLRITDGVLNLVKSRVAVIVSETGTLVHSTIHFVAGTKAGAVSKLYVDGLDVTGTVTNQTLADTAVPLSLFYDPISGENFSGAIAEVAIFNRALTAAEIFRLFDSVDTLEPGPEGSAAVAAAVSPAATGKKGGKGTGTAAAAVSPAATGRKGARGSSSDAAAVSPAATGKKGARGSTAVTAAVSPSATGEAEEESASGSGATTTAVSPSATGRKGTTGSAAGTAAVSPAATGKKGGRSSSALAAAVSAAATGVAARAAAAAAVTAVSPGATGRKATSGAASTTTAVHPTAVGGQDETHAGSGAGAVAVSVAALGRKGGRGAATITGTGSSAAQGRKGGRGGATGGVIVTPGTSGSPGHGGAGLAITAVSPLASGRKATSGAAGDVITWVHPEAVGHPSGSRLRAHIRVGASKREGPLVGATIRSTVTVEVDDS